VQRLATKPFGSCPTDGEFAKMTDYVSESFHDLFAGELECFKVGVPEGCAKDAHGGETPPSSPNDRARERNQAPMTGPGRGTTWLELLREQ
jgi:hypothetical protein